LVLTKALFVVIHLLLGTGATWVAAETLFTSYGATSPPILAAIAFFVVGAWLIIVIELARSIFVNVLGYGG
jgi:hypothetical protein